MANKRVTLPVDKKGPYTKAAEKIWDENFKGPHAAAMVREEIVNLQHRVNEIQNQFELWMLDYSKKLEGLRREFYSLEERLAKR